jgi:hypothetical protein
MAASRSLALAGALMVLAAHAAAMPEGLQLGAERLAAASCGIRETLWIEHYAAGLYLPRRADPAAQLSDPSVPKALRVEIINSRLMPPDIPKKWRKPIEQQDARALEALRSAYRQLQPGDEVLISYTPRAGVRVGVNGQPVAHSGGHAVIEALLKTWADDEPLPKKLGAVMARNRCPLPATASR